VNSALQVNSNGEDLLSPKIEARMSNLTTSRMGNDISSPFKTHLRKKHFRLNI
jgi:hypothetical protein